MSEMSGQSTIT